MPDDLGIIHGISELEGRCRRLAQNARGNAQLALRLLQTGEAETPEGRATALACLQQVVTNLTTLAGDR